MGAALDRQPVPRMDILTERHQRKMHSFSVRFLLAASLVATSAACSPTVDQRGNQPLPEHLSEIKPGRVTKSDVVALIGTPATTSAFSDDRWYYISSKVETWAFFKPEELDRQIVVIDFDKSGTVIAVKKLGLEDGKEIEMVSRETPTAGKDLSLLEQLIGNVGKFNNTSKDKATGNGM